MRPAIFILGTSHPLQCGAAKCGADNIALLEEKVRQVLSEHGIGRIAEEMSEDSLRDQLGDEAGRGTVCQRITRGTGIGVDFVDLDREERDRLGLSDRVINGFTFSYGEDDTERAAIREAFNALCGKVRERVWVGRVLSGGEWPVLFVCGADHAVSVRKLFEGVGVQATIICRDFDPQSDP